jgi:predicted amidohydrolase
VRDIRVATVQFQPAPGDKAYNLGRVRHFVTEAAGRGVEIIAFPEMCLTGYWHVRKLSREAFEALAEPVDGPCTQELLRLSREHGMTVGAGRGWLMRWLPSRAHDNGMFLLFTNGIGPDDDEIRTGNAMVLDPYGDVIAETRAFGDDMVVADLDASSLPTSSGRRWLRARRPDLYGSLTRPTGQEQDTRRVRFGE